MPDFRGLFLRGVGGNSTALGVQQGDAIRNISGHVGSVLRTGTSGAFVESVGPGSVAGAAHFNTNHVYFDISRVVPTANENRPANMAVRYFIRAAL